MHNYDSAVSLMESQEYDSAIVKFNELDGYEDSESMITECNYRKSLSLLNGEKYEEAISGFEKLADYKDSESMILACKIRMLQSSKVGDTVLFGNYEGCDEWVVLERNDHQVLLLSKVAIEKKHTKKIYMVFRGEKIF